MVYIRYRPHILQSPIPRIGLPLGSFFIQKSAIYSLIINGSDMTQSSRRNFLKTSAVGAAAITSVSGVGIYSAQAQSKNQKSNIE